VRHRFHPEADAEFEEAVQFYKTRGHDLAGRFAGEIKAAIRKIVGSPERWRKIEEDLRRCSLRVFPYAILYTIEKDHLLIIAIAHAKRRPGYWRRRLTQRQAR